MKIYPVQEDELEDLITRASEIGTYKAVGAASLVLLIGFTFDGWMSWPLSDAKFSVLLIAVMGSASSAIFSWGLYFRDRGKQKKKADYIKATTVK